MPRDEFEQIFVEYRTECVESRHSGFGGLVLQRHVSAVRAVSGGAAGDVRVDAARRLAAEAGGRDIGDANLQQILWRRELVRVVLVDQGIGSYGAFAAQDSRFLSSLFALISNERFRETAAVLRACLCAAVHSCIDGSVLSDGESSSAG